MTTGKNKSKPTHNIAEVDEDAIDLNLDKSHTGPENEKPVTQPDDEDDKITVKNDDEPEDIVIDNSKKQKDKERDDEDDDDDDQSAKRSQNNAEGDDDDDLDAEARRLRNRASRQASRDNRRRAAREKDNLIRTQNKQLEEMRREIDAIKTSTSTSKLDHDALLIQRAYDQRSQNLTAAEQDLRRAMAAQDENQIIEAQKRWYAAQRDVEVAQTALSKVNELRSKKEETQPLPTQQTKEKADSIERHRRKFFDDNKWYDPQSPGRDIRTAKLISEELIDEGFDPNHEEYWDELNERLREEIPHRYEREKRDSYRDRDDDQRQNNRDTQSNSRDDRAPRRQPVSTGGGQRESTQTRQNAEELLTPSQRNMLKNSIYGKGTQEYKELVQEYIEMNRKKQRS